ncbi:tail assembly protein I [Rhizobium phage RHph_Y1_11]|nr:tail assembly protein I [Rhizobium phage RHph_Y1_11]
MMRTIILHGELGKLYGKRWHLAVEDLPEILRAIGVQRPGFQQYVEGHDFQIVRGKRRDGDYISKEEVGLRLGSTEEIHIMVAIKAAGGKGGGLGKIIAGVLLAGFAFFAAPAMGLASFAGVSMKSIGMIGIGLVFSGVSSMLSAQKKKSDKDDSSKLFSNVPQTSEQGICVPVGYGRFRAEDMPLISSRIITAQVAT